MTATSRCGLSALGSPVLERASINHDSGQTASYVHSSVLNVPRHVLEVLAVSDGGRVPIVNDPR